jgi:MarR family transcriptional regulator, lower aerobic nicotinate degradation pathway regulator
LFAYKQTAQLGKTVDVGRKPAATLQQAPRATRGQRAAYLLDEQIGFILRQAYQRNSLLFAGQFADELTPTQWAAIAKLGEVGGCSQNHLGRLIAMDAATVKGVIDRLMRRGLVESAPSPTDRRRLLLTLSANGRKAYERGAARALQVSASTLQPLKAGEQATLLRLLKRLR